MVLGNVGFKRRIAAMREGKIVTMYQVDVKHLDINPANPPEWIIEKRAKIASSHAKIQGEHHLWA